MSGKEAPNASDIHNKRSGGMSRRRLMRALSALGFSTVSAATLTAEDIQAAAGNQIPITYAFAWDDPNDLSSSYSPQTKLVPADWYNDVMHAQRVYDRSDFLSRPGVTGVRLKPAKYGGRNSVIEVEVSRKAAARAGTSVSEVAGRIPEFVEDVPVSVVEVQKRDLADSTCANDQNDCYIKDYGSSPPAGATCGADSSGTLSSPLVKNGDHYFCTNHHLWSGTPDKLYQYYSHVNIGNVVEYDCHDDFVAAEPINGHTPSRDIVESSYHTAGHYTKVGVQSLAGDSATVTKRGVRTCKTCGPVHGIGDATSDTWECALRHDQVHWGNQGLLGDGDSGSIAYRPMYDGTNRALVVCLNAGRTAYYQAGDYVWGTGAYHIYQDYGYGW